MTKAEEKKWLRVFRKYGKFKGGVKQVLWDDEVDKVKEIKPGCLILFRHAFRGRSAKIK